MNHLKKFVSLLVEEEMKKKQAAIMFIQDEQGKVLSVSRKTDPGQLGLPGGKVDPGETPEEAAIREIKEETGLIASDLKQVFVFQDVGWFETFTFVGKVSGTIATDEEGKVRWVTTDQLLDPKISPYAKYNAMLFKELGIKT